MGIQVNASHKSGGAWDAVNLDINKGDSRDLTQLFEGQPFAQAVRVGGPGEIHLRLLGARSRDKPVVYLISKGGERIPGKFTEVVRCTCANLVIEA